MSFKKFSCFATAAVALSTLLVSCGGGGGGETYSTSTGKAPGETYFANGEGSIATIPLQFDVEGTIKLDGTTYTLQQPAGASGCAMTSVPADADTVACNALVAAKAFMLCENMTTRDVGLTLFNTKYAEQGSIGDLAGLSMSGLACGPTGVRNTGDTLIFSPDASISVETVGPSTFTSGTGIPASFTQPTGANYTSWQRRWAIYKVASGSATNIYLVDLYQSNSPGAADRPSAVYFAQKS